MHTTPAQRICSIDRQFLIYNTFGPVGSGNDLIVHLVLVGATLLKNAQVSVASNRIGTKLCKILPEFILIRRYTFKMTTTTPARCSLMHMRAASAGLRLPATQPAERT